MWGTTQSIPVLCFVLEVVEPGLLVVKHHRGAQAGKYVNVAVLEGDHVKLVDESATTLPDCPDLLTSLLGFHTTKSWVGSVNVLVQLAVSMRAHGRGGSLLIVPAGQRRVAGFDRAPDHLRRVAALRGAVEDHQGGRRRRAAAGLARLVPGSHRRGGGADGGGRRRGDCPTTTTCWPSAPRSPGGAARRWSSS